MNKVISITKYLAENLKRTRTCVKILFVGIFIQMLSVILYYYITYLFINSGGLNTFAKEGWWYIFLGGAGILLSLYFFAVICFILSFFKPPIIINLILSIIGFSILYSIHGTFIIIPKISGFFGQPDKDIVRYYARTRQTIENLEEFSKKITLLRTKDDFIFTEQSVKDLSDAHSFDNERYHYIFNPDFDFNMNLLGLNPRQISPDTVILFQSKNDNSPFSGPSDISAEWHYDRGSLIVFGDGRIEFIKKENFKNLRWYP